MVYWCLVAISVARAHVISNSPRFTFPDDPCEVGGKSSLEEESDTVLIAPLRVLCSESLRIVWVMEPWSFLTCFLSDLMCFESASTLFSSAASGTCCVGIGARLGL